MTATKLFKNGNSQAVRIPAELAYSSWDVDLEIERQFVVFQDFLVDQHVIARMRVQAPFLDVFGIQWFVFN